MVSVLHKELEYNVEKLKCKKDGDQLQPKIRIKSGSVQMKFYSRDWLIQSIVY